MATFDLVIFDLDGTVVDSLPDIAAALNRTLRGAGREPLPLGRGRVLRGRWRGQVGAARAAGRVSRGCARAARRGISDSVRRGPVRRDASVSGDRSDAAAVRGRGAAGDLHQQAERSGAAVAAAAAARPLLRRTSSATATATRASRRPTPGAGCSSVTAVMRVALWSSATACPTCASRARWALARPRSPGATARAIGWRPRIRRGPSIGRPSWSTSCCVPARASWPALAARWRLTTDRAVARSAAASDLGRRCAIARSGLWRATGARSGNRRRPRSATSRHFVGERQCRLAS